jgi:hypothetical protein
MKYFLATAALVLAACAGAYGATFLINTETQEMRQAARDRKTMAWLRTEFNLNQAQYAAIQNLHSQFLQECAGEAAAIMAARQRKDSPGEVAGLEAACVRAMTNHFQKTALLMSPEDGQRYLDMVLPHIADYDNRRAPASN